MAASVAGAVDLLGEIAQIGRDRATGGFTRFAWSDADLTLREWFVSTAETRGLDVETDRNGNLWAWWGAPGSGAVVTGSHLDSVPQGGAYDGPLGVASAFAAIDLMRADGVQPGRPLAVTCFTDEEGGRFGVACIGSRLATGSLSAEAARALTDRDGVTMAEALTHAGRDPSTLGPDPTRLGDIAAFVELHVEQGRGLIDLGYPVALGTGVLPHGRWRVDLRGAANHAGTTRMEDRADPMVAYAHLVLAARAAATVRDTSDRAARATVGRVSCAPNAVNAVPSAVSGWLDLRGADDAVVDELLAEITAAVEVVPGIDCAVTEESRTPRQAFDPRLTARLAELFGSVPILDTGAGHDAGVLAGAGVPSAMVFVRNPTGVSHAPDEFAEDADCEAGVRALADALTCLVAERL